MSKFSFKKIAALALTASAFAALTAGAAGCARKSTDPTEPDNIEITRLTPPDDGSLPTAHTCAENLAYIVSVFDSQEQYHSYSYGVTSASIATQTTRNFRDYKDGVLLTTDLTYSSMVKSGTQTCTVKNEEGEYEVYFRTSQAPEADTLPSQAVWSEEAPTIFTEYSYHYTYGLLPNELFNYIVNENNIIDSEQIKVNSDGTYTQNFTLDPVASTYFYQFGMKTRGGLSGFPDFKSITFSVTFDGGWKILSASMHEVADVNKGIVVSSVSDFATEYWYGDDHFDNAHYSYYESYYKKYLGDETLEQGGATDEKLVVDVTNVLSNGFSQIMNGGAQFEISAKLGNNTYVGYAFVSLDLADPLGTLALKVSLGKSLKEQTLYIEYADGDMAAYYGNDFALEANLAEVKLAVGQFGDVIDKITAAFGGGQSSAEEPLAETEGGDPLAELMDAMVLTAGEKQAVLTLDTDDLLGLGIGIDLRLVFGISNNVITFRGGTVGGLSVGGETVDLDVKIVTTTAPEISRPSAEESANLADYIADVHSLLGADLIKIRAVLDGNGEKVSIDALKGLSAEVTAYADIDGVTVGADADVSYIYKGNKISAKVGVWYGYDPAVSGYGQAVVSLKELNGAPADIDIKCDIAQIAETVSTLVRFGGGESGAGTDGLVSIINGALSTDFSGLLTGMYADKASVKIGLSVDTLLQAFNIDTGIRFGSCNLKYQRGEGVYGGSLSADLPALGFGMEISGAAGEVVRPDLDSCLDAAYVLEDVLGLANAQLLKAHISLDGSADGVKISALNGVKADLDVYFNLENIAVKAVADVSYLLGGLNGDEVSAKLSVWYGKGEEGLGKAVISLDRINGVPLDAKVRCDVSELAQAVGTLLDYAGVKLQPFSDGVTDDLGDVLNKILGADFAELLPTLKTDANTLTVGLGVDAVLDLFGVNTGIEFGNLSLVYDHSSDEKLCALMPALGLNVSVSGAEGEIVCPDESDCLDLCDLVDTVNAVWQQVNGIIDGQSVAFRIDDEGTYLSLDGIIVKIWGDGEVSWKKGGEYVALDLSMSITEKKSDVATLRLIYDKNADGTPLVKMALNQVGLEIYKEDIESVRNGFNDIYNKVKGIFGGDAAVAALSGDTEPTEATVTDGEGENGNKVSGNDKLMAVLFGVLASDDWVNLLDKFTLTSNGKSVALKYLSDNAANVDIGADGGLTLHYDAKIGDKFTMGGGVEASSVTGSLIPEIQAKFASCNMASSENGTAGFVRLAYDFLFDAVSSLTVDNILGSNTYAVKFNLNGNNSNVAELKDVFVNAEIYVTGKNGEQGKLAEADLDVDAAGVVIKLNVITERRNNNTYFYINLNQVMDIKLPDLKVVATQDSLFKTFEVLFDTVNKTDILGTVAKFIPEDSDKSTAGDNGKGDGKEDGVKISDETKGKLADLLAKLLNFDFGDAVEASEVEGVLTASVDLDNVMSQLGVKTGTLGKVEAVINHNSHSMVTNVQAPVEDEKGNVTLKNWLSLSSELTARKDYSKEPNLFDRNEYINIEFLPTLIGDLIDFAVDGEGSVHDKFTLSGKVNANLDLSLLGIPLKKEVNIDIRSLTVGLTSLEDLYVSGILHIGKVSVSVPLVMSLKIPESTVGITYKNGMLTLVKNLDSKPLYRIMTFDYFIDHLLSESDSVLQWWLDIEGWDGVATLLSKAGATDLASGSNNPQSIYLYEPVRSTGSVEVISMADFVEAIRIVTGRTIGEERQTNYISNAKYNDVMDNLETEFGLQDGDYYGFSLNAGKVTGGILNKLFAAITRNESGVTGVKASGALSMTPVSLISVNLTFSAQLDYHEGLDTAYELGTSVTGDVKASPDMYTSAMEIVDASELKYNFKHKEEKTDANGKKLYDEEFGCITVDVGSDGNYSVSQDYTKALVSYNLILKYRDKDDKVQAVRDTSTVYLYDDNSPVYADETGTERIIYSTQKGVIGDKTAKIDGKDLIVYAVYVEAAEVNFYSENGDFVGTAHLYKGASVPTEVGGLSTISGPFYDKECTQAVKAGDVIDAGGTLNLYGTFVETEVEINGVKYVFTSEGGSHYIAAGKAGTFDDTYSVKGKTLVLESRIGGYNVTEIAANAFADTEGKPIKSVIVPATVTKVGASAFKDNVNMQSAVFLADNVTFDGKDGNSKTMPFYGCSTSSDEESTELTVYYNNITASGGKWNHFRYVSKFLSFNFYIGENGGGAHSGGTWQYTDFEANVELNGVSGGTLTVEAVENILSRHFPYVSTEAYIGSIYEANVFTAFESSLKDLDFTRGAVNYKCVYTVDYATAGGKTVVTFNVTYQPAASIKVLSDVEFTYYGETVKANTPTEITIPVNDDGSFELATPASATHKFVEWSVSGDGKDYTATWTEKQKYKLTIKLNRGFTDTNRVFIITNDVKPSEGKQINGGSFSAATVDSIDVYEGHIEFVIENDELTIRTGDTTYIIYVNEAKIGGQDKGNKRNGLKFSIADTENISGNTELTLSYS